MEWDDEEEVLDVDDYLDSLELECRAGGSAPSSVRQADLPSNNQPAVTPEAVSEVRPASRPQQVEVPRAIFHIVKSVLETQVLTMVLPRPQMTPHELTALWEKEWGVMHATRIKFRSPSSSPSKWLSHHGDHLPLAPVVVVLETKGLGSILNSLECAFRQQRGAHVETLRQGQEFQWSSWTPQQALDENHRIMSEKELQWHRERAAEADLPKPPPPPQNLSTPLIDPYASPEVYAAGAPPKATATTAPATQKPQPSASPVTHTTPYPKAAVSGTTAASKMPPEATTSPAPQKAATSGPRPFREITANRTTPAAPSAPPQQGAPAKARTEKPSAEGEGWAAQQQRLKKEQREARLAENLRRRQARGGEPQGVPSRPPAVEPDARLHHAANLQDPQSYAASQEQAARHSAKGAPAQGDGKEREDRSQRQPRPDSPPSENMDRHAEDNDFGGVPLRVLRSKQLQGSGGGGGLLSWGK